MGSDNESAEPMDIDPLQGVEEGMVNAWAKGLDEIVEALDLPEGQEVPSFDGFSSWEAPKPVMYPEKLLGSRTQLNLALFPCLGHNQKMDPSIFEAFLFSENFQFFEDFFFEKYFLCNQLNLST